MKEIRFTGKVAVVTGAASGMGLSASQGFARLGAYEPFRRRRPAPDVPALCRTEG